jgi:uncharacterized protein (TIGR02646 family)
MRPIDRGDWPLDDDGNRKRYSNHRSWRKDLIDRIGSYCSFCNMRLTDSPQVEHVIAQNIDHNLALDWDNLLLACGACNRVKSDHPCPPSTHYLPQFHNTHLAFDAVLTAHPESPDELAAFVTFKDAPADEVKTRNTIALCALDRDTTREFSQITDARWRDRAQAMLTANIWRVSWDGGRMNPSEFARLLVTVVEGRGFWSVWFDRFIDVPEVRRALVEAFPGTRRSCFDADFMPVADMAV